METILVQNKFFYKQTTGGRVRMNKIMVLIGNRDGLFGYSFKRLPWGKGTSGIRQVVNRSGYRLCYFDRLEERTVYHNFFSRYGHCTVFVSQKPPGTYAFLYYYMPWRNFVILIDLFFKFQNRLWSCCSSLHQRNLQISWH